MLWSSCCLSLIKSLLCLVGLIATYDGLHEHQALFTHLFIYQASIAV